MALALGSALLGLFSSVANAASISYGNFGPVPPGVTFLNVTETSTPPDPLPLYGPPTAFPTGLDFNPVGFSAAGAAGSGDVTNGQLNFTVMGPVINAINVSEAGDYTLVGIGTPATQAFAGAILRATVTQINGVNVAPIVLAPASASVGFNLVANPGMVQPWSLGTSLNVAAQMAALGLGNATKVDVAINNQLIALSEPSSAAFIHKKEFIIDIDTVIPEPSTLALAGMALCGLAINQSRRRN
jgi:hypothetical protein